MQLAFLNEVLNSEYTASLIQRLVDDYENSYDSYVAAAEAVGITPLNDSLEIDDTGDIESIPSASLSTLATPTWLDSYWSRLASAKAELETLNRLLQLMVEKTSILNSLANEYASQVGRTPSSLLEDKRKSSRSGLPIYHLPSMLPGECGVPVTVGFDVKLWAIVGYRTDNCDGSLSLRIKVKVTGLGHFEIDCTIGYGPDRATTCNPRIRKGFNIGIISAHLDVGIEYSTDPALNRGIYFCPELCYNLLFKKDCGTELVYWNWNKI